MEGKLESLYSKSESLPRVYMQGNQLCYVFGTLKNPIGITVVQTFCEKKKTREASKKYTSKNRTLTFLRKLSNFATLKILGSTIRSKEELSRKMNDFPSALHAIISV